ncbi:bifunctional riboflavin kinase/FAD synthetase [Bacillus sp. FJAT-49736]|uniref:bifunctional riboflavin kinase/FAD synthetase n=1 Tax=Bacillus sp. FJAT-49736 TaxID=2833582 RepID=UPI001BCA57B8|nr:bifunctional riboflavin kinase/FAD synthetase [Bacillus sp. FJAT-49736]MBS4172562.1 bifunctional riboflavin kinase/FAD synthetase [Bacillus sp. FJAT-49736]
MKVMTLHHPHSYSKTDFPPLVMALGYFDGIHLGHKKVITTAKNIAEEHIWKSAVMTFDPHPSVVLSAQNKHVELITPLDEKIRLMEELGIDYLIIVRFTSSFASLDPQEFVNQYIIGLNVKHVVAGFDFTYGKFGKGTIDTMPLHSKNEFGCTKVEKLNSPNGDEKVGSTLIRKLLHEGDVTGAYSLLGRFYRTDGIVVHGEKRGRQIGFPTANIKLNSDYIVPQNGVYAVKIYVNNQWHQGVCNIGVKPTFKNPDEFTRSIEVHIIDFDHSIYGEEVTIEWHKRMRDEQKFDGIEALKSQIAKDKQTTIDYFKQLDK